MFETWIKHTQCKNPVETGNFFFGITVTVACIQFGPTNQDTNVEKLFGKIENKEVSIIYH